MSAPWLIVLASFLFATMGVCVKLASAHYAAGEIVFYRGLIGALMMLAFARWRRGSLATPVPAMHFWRSATGVVALCLWFYAIGDLPLATAHDAELHVVGVDGAVPDRRRDRRPARPRVDGRAGRRPCCSASPASRWSCGRPSSSSSSGTA